MSESSLSPPDSPVQVLPRELQEFQQIYGEFLNDQELLELYESTRERREGYVIEEKPAREPTASDHRLPPGLLLSPEQRDFYSRYQGPITAQDVRSLQHETAMIRAMITKQEASGHDSPPLVESPQQGSPQLGLPQQGSPQLGLPQQGSPQQGSPQQASPQASPQQGSPQQASPQASPQQGSFQQASPQASPQQASPQPESPQHGPLQQASPQQASPQGSPQHGSPGHDAPQQGSLQQGSSQQGSPKQDSPQASPQGGSPQHVASPQGSSSTQAPPSPGSLHENLGAVTVREAIGLPAETLVDTFRLAMQRVSSSSGDESSDDDSDASSEISVEKAHELLWDLIWRLCSSVLFMLVFGAKEIVHRFCAYADMFCICPVTNLFLYFLKRRGFYQDRNYINSRRLFLVHGVQTSRNRILVRVAALWVGFAFLLVYIGAPDKKPFKPTPPAKVDLMSIYGATTSKLQPTKQTSTSSGRFESDEWKRALETTYVDDSEDIDWKTRLRSWLPISDLSPRGIVCSVCNRFCGQSKAMLPDHALRTTGSLVLRELTSPTFGGDDKNVIPPIFMQPITITGMPTPVAAITDFQNPGACWPMAGKQGSLGVRLRRPVSVKAVSIDYMDYPHVIPSKSAPADFEVWGLTHKGNRFWKYPWNLLASLEEGDGKVYLGKFKYDIKKASRVQTFNIQVKSPPIKDIVFRFLDNWGHEEYTCIYRVRVHGVVV